MKSMDDLCIDSRSARFSSPGTPNIRVTPSFSSALTRRSEPLAIGGSIVGELAPQRFDELRGGHRTRERCALTGPLGAVAELVLRLACRVERLGEVISDGIVGHLARPDAVSELGEAVREASRGSARDCARHHRVVRGATSERAAVTLVGE